MGEIQTLLPESGDVKSTWDSENEEEVALAKKQFDEAKEKGFLAFKVKKDGTKGKQIKEFDEEAESIIMTPPPAGG